MDLEKKVLKFWQDLDIFKKTLSSRAKGEHFVFYDGPPFATGLPHYGHILTGTIKDAIPRYQTMRGRYVRREWGWDCHGLPLENIIEKELGLLHKKDIEEFGILKFNKAASNAVLRYEKDWKEIIPKTGRFVDMENIYKTMDPKYTESVWWAFKTLYDKELIYEGHKIMFVCPRCETTLAQSEVALGGYHDITDISIIAKFELTSSLDTNMRMDTNVTNSTNGKKIFLLAWTTTPWTLPGNTALAINKDFEYSLIESEDEDVVRKGKFIVATERLPFLKIKYSTLKTFKGSELVGKSYIPPFDYFYKDKNIKNHEQGWKIYHADFVTADTGTGIAHEAPAFGAEDMELAVSENLPVVQHVGMDGKMKEEVSDFSGLYVKQKGDTQSTDIKIIKNLAHRGLLFAKEKIIHPYPICWRCETPLLNYATSSWFVKVTAIKEKLIEENKKILWVPSHIKDGRFGKWLEGAKDWAISRTRYWGAPLPVWRCAKCEKTEIIGSLEDLQKKMPESGNKYFVMRHGESMSNIYNLEDSKGDPSNHMDEEGREEIIKAARDLAKKGITMIVSSPFPRTKETSEIVAREIGLPSEKIIFDESFVESVGGGWEDGSVRARVLAGLYELDKKFKNETVLIVTHGAPMWMLVTGAEHLSGKETIKFREDLQKKAGMDYFIKNAEVKEINFKPFPHNDSFELDFHRPYIDEVKLPCECGGEMERIKDVFDCWFESGSMPYGQFHYPFDPSSTYSQNSSDYGAGNKELFEKNYPADFIAEGLDQTRGWFYSMLVLGVALFDRTPYKKVIVSGMVLGEDGRKMSKRLRNYPEVTEVIEKYGADSLRYYLLSSPLIRGEDVAFSEKSVGEVYRKIVSRLLNVHSFYATYSHELEAVDSYKKSDNPLDQWILSRLLELMIEITRGMEAYELDVATRGIEKFVDDLSTWYLRRSRERFKGDDNEDKEWALSTTRYILFEFSKLIAPFMPFVAEDIYQKVKGIKDKESVHLEDWPEVNGQLTTDNQQLIERMANTRRLVELALALRAEGGIKVRQPLQKLKVKSDPSSKAELATGQGKLKDVYSELVKDEVNVKEIIFDSNMTEEVELDIIITPELKKEGQLRELIRNIQDLRKKEKLTPHDVVSLLVDASVEAKEIITKFEAALKRATLASGIIFEKNSGEKITIDKLEFTITIKKHE